LVRNHNGVEGGTRWPPPPGDGVPIHPFTGGVVNHQGPVNIAYAMQAGTTVGQAYLAAGLRVRYRYQGHVYSTTAWMVTVGCVVVLPETQTQTPPWCDKAIKQATKAVQKQAAANS
jgi:hypothetical protein